MAFASAWYSAVNVGRVSGIPDEFVVRVERMVVDGC
jgi:hypothetical protein